MATRNTGVLTKVINALDGMLISNAATLAQLEEHFKDQLLTVASDVQTIDQQAQTLRLAITTEEAGKVLDYMAEHHLANIHIETADEVINALYPDRFVEP